MDCLTIDYWKDFSSPDGKFAGRKFEKLIKSLLPSLGLQLTETKISWDGSRDFEDKEKKIWAECKMYKENISLQIISPTLVMAVIKKPKKIYFFSYSRLNNNAVNHLAQFQNLTNVPIRIFDDVSLESLLLNNPSTLKKFFPKFTSPRKQRLDSYNITVGFSKDPEIEYYEETVEDPKNKELYIYSIFSIDIFIRNLNIKKILDGKIILNDLKRTGSFLLLNKGVRNNNYEIKLSIETGSVFFYRFYFKALKGGKQTLPSFLFYSSKSKKIIALKPRQVKISSIIKTNLIGKQYISLLKKFQSQIQARRQPIFFTVYGESGTGKSRMLKEFTEALFEEEFNILKFDGEDTEDSRFKDFIQKVFSKLHKLPLVEGDKPNPLAQKEFIYDLLYGSSFQHGRRINECVEYFIKGLTDQKYALLIDNLQNFDEFTLTFIDDLITRCQETSIRVAFIFCFNTNLLYRGTKNFQVFDRLILKGKQNEGIFHNAEIAGFSEKDFNLFLDHCLSSLNKKDKTKFSVMYPETVLLFKEKVINRPLFIEQTLLYLEQENAITRLHDKFYVRSINRFHQILNGEFPKNLFDLLSLRWNILKLRIGKKNQEQGILLESAIRFFSFFNMIKYNQALAFGITLEILNILEENGFIIIDERDNVTFYHHQLFIFFKEKLRMHSIDEFNSYKNYIEDQNLSNRYFYQYFIVLYKLNQITSQHATKAFDKIFSSFRYDDFIIEFSNCLFDILISNVIKFRSDIVLKAFLRIGKIIQTFESMEGRQLLLSIANNYVTDNLNKFLKYGSNYLDFIHGFANACITVHKDEEAILLLNEVINNQNKIHFQYLKEKYIYFGKIYNRLCVVYKAIGSNENAFNAGLHSQKMAKKSNNKELMIKNYLDIANVYGRRIESKNTILELWKKAVSTYKEDSDRYKDQKAMVQLYESQINIWSSKYEEGIDLLKDGVRFCEANSIYFFGIKYLLIQVVAEITFKEKSNVDFNKLFELISKAKDWAIRYQINRSYWKVLFIEGRLHLLHNSKKFQEASECFIQMLDQFIRLRSSAIEEYNYQVFEFLGYFFRKNPNKELAEIFFNLSRKLNSSKIKDLLLEASFKSNKDLKTFYNNHIPLLIYNDGHFDFPIIG